MREREEVAARLGRPVTALPTAPEVPGEFGVAYPSITRPEQMQMPVPQVTPEEFRAQEAQAAVLGRPVAAIPPERIPPVMAETFRDREAEAARLGRMVTGPPPERFAPEEETRLRREAFMAQFREDALAQAAAGYQARAPGTGGPGEGYFSTIPIEEQLRYHKLIETPTGMRSEYEPQFRGVPSRGMTQFVNLQGDVTYTSDPDTVKQLRKKGYTARSVGPSLPAPGSAPSTRAQREATFMKQAQVFQTQQKRMKPFGTPRFATT
jgi:hypothetical protein